ncbi:hypothetical protein ACFE04_023348 [Oxalis oulophora]
MKIGGSLRGGDRVEEEEFEVQAKSEQRESGVVSSFKRRLSLLLRTDSILGLSGTEILRSNASGRLLPSHNFIIHPDNWKYKVWTHFILIWAVYSSVFTPLEFGFFRGLPERLFLLDIAGQIAFLIDIVVHFFLAYRDTHSYSIIYNRKQIALRYLKSRFFVDFMGCLPWDAIYKACHRKELIRYMLWIRLSRALRVTEFFERIEKDIRINYLFTRIVKLLVVEFYCTHTAACIFYYLATTVPRSKEGNTWIGSLQLGDSSYSNFREIDLWKRYVTALYFAIVTMATVGYGEIHAVNLREMIFVMVYVSLDMILGAYLLGNMAALIVKGSRTERFRDRMTDLIKYMNRNNLGKHISNQIKRHLRLQYDRSYNEATILQDIPASIRTRISEKLYEPFIREVTLFKGCSVGFLKQIATRVHEEFFLPGEVILEQGKVVDQLYILIHGLVEEVGREEGEEAKESPINLQTYSLIGEVSFLCNSPESHTVQVRELCRVLLLDKHSLTQALEMYFSDGRIILSNLLDGKDTNLQNKLLESDVALYIVKHETEMAIKLNCAAYDGDFHRLKRLIGLGANPNKVDYDGRSPLHIAASKGHEDITRFLIEQRVDINSSDKFGNTPLLEAIKKSHDHVASLLAGEGAALKIEDSGNFLCTTVAKRDSELLKKLLAHGINPNSKNYDNRTALHLAASEGLYSMVNTLIEAGASVLSRDRWGNTPVDDARIGGNRDLIKLLEAARNSKIPELSGCSQQNSDKVERRKCTVFPFHPCDEKKVEKRYGIVVWIPQTIGELIGAASEQLRCSSTGCCLVAENGGRITDVNMIIDDEKLFLVSEEN